MKAILTRLLAAAALLSVALITAFIVMRIAIHGREVVVPNLANLSDADAAQAAKKLGLNLSVENRFYSAGVSPNHVLSQSPAAGSRVRRSWQIRVTESLGGQKVPVPDVIGETERPASLVLRRLQLELGPVAHLPAPVEPGIVLAQSPAPNAESLNGPRVTLLVADEEAAPETIAFVMPQITGLTLSAATARLATAGLHIASAQEPSAPSALATDPLLVEKSTQNAPQNPANPLNLPAQDPAIPPTITRPAPASPNSTILTQSPAPGHRVSRADSIRVTVTHSLQP